MNIEQLYKEVPSNIEQLYKEVPSNVWVVNIKNLLLYLCVNFFEIRMGNELWNVKNVELDLDIIANYFFQVYWRTIFLYL